MSALDLLPALRGYNPRLANDTSNPDVRYGYIRGALTGFIEDLQWIATQREIASMAIRSAVEKIKKEPVPENFELLAKALVHQSVINDRCGSMQRAAENTIDRCILGEHEQDRRSKAYTRGIVEDAKRRPVRTS